MNVIWRKFIYLDRGFSVECEVFNNNFHRGLCFSNEMNKCSKFQINNRKNIDNFNLQSGEMFEIGAICQF